MNKGRRIWLGLLVLAAVAGASALLWPGQKEPNYLGKNLSDWVVMYGRFDPEPASHRGAAAAVRHIGTNSLPFLLDWVQYEPPPWRKNFQRFPFGNWLEDRNAIRAWGALESLRALGSEAAGAIPELVRLLGSTNESVCVKAANALGAIGTNSIPVFLDLLTNQAFSGRMREIALGNGWRSLGTNSRTAVPVLIDHLRDGDGEVARSSAWLLGIGGVEPKTAVPALVDALSRTNSSIRWSAVWALWRFRPYVNVAPYLVGSLSDPDPSIRETATNLLRQIAPEVLSPAVIPGPYR